MFRLVLETVVTEIVKISVTTAFDYLKESENREAVKEGVSKAMDKGVKWVKGAPEYHSEHIALWRAAVRFIVATTGIASGNTVR